MKPARLLALATASRATARVRPSPLEFTTTAAQDIIFRLGDSQFLAVASDPVLSIPHFSQPWQHPIVHLQLESSVVTRDHSEQVVSSYLADDDVLNEDFFDKIILTTSDDIYLDTSAFKYFESLSSEILHVPRQKSSDRNESIPPFPPGPYLAVANGTALQFSKVYRLYEDTYRTFVNGIYQSNDGYKPLDVFEPLWGYPMIPIPSRLDSIGDTRPLAGKRIGVKDIYDIRGVITTCGSRAFTAISSPADTTAPSIQRIIDLGGSIVGKQKTAQFASAAQPWEWSDAYYPQNPRGDGLLSCSASSAGGGCSIAAYNWLDIAIGSDTGQSVRQPAAFSGIYGNRPSQGLMTLDRVMPIAYGIDTAGCFARDPEDWITFAKAWYTPSLYSAPALHGLPELSVPDTDAFPRRILYPVDHLPLQNPAAEILLQDFLYILAENFNMTVERFNLTQKIEETTSRPLAETLDDFKVLLTNDQLRHVATPLLEQYRPHFPSLDKPFRTAFRNFTVDDDKYKRAMQNRSRDSDLWHQNVLYSTDESCSESLVIYDIGTGGLPSFREKELNEAPGASFPIEPGSPGAASNTASYFGDADFTIPIGQVPYFSNVTYEEVLMPVTVNLVVKRGCDFVLFNLIGKLSELGVLESVQTGPVTFTA